MTRRQRHIDSWHKDKAVKDNTTESWLCVDCGVNTAPGIPSGPDTRIAFAMGAESVADTYDHQTEVYHVKDAVWTAAGMRAWNGCLCIGCLEKRLGRQLRPRDFARHDKRVWADMPCTDRLLDRRGWRRMTVTTDEGEREVIVGKRDADRIAAMIAPGELPYMETGTTKRGSQARS